MTARRPRAFRVRLSAFLSTVSVAIAIVIAMASLASVARADYERFAWTGWHTPTQQVRFVQSRLEGSDLTLWMDGIGPQPVQDPLALLRGLPAAQMDTGPNAWNPVPPPARWAHSMIYDSIRDRLLVFGGQGYSGWNDELWALNLSGIPQWTPVATGGTAPGPRGFHSAVFDSVGDRMLVFGGTDGSIQNNEVWQLSFAGLATWSKLTVAGAPPSPRVNHTAVIDKLRNRMIVYGGSSNGTTVSDAYALNLAGAPTWTQLFPTGTAPARTTHAAVYDAIGDRMIVTCGLDLASQPKNDTWSLSLAGTPAWSALAPTGTPPSPRLGASALYDRVRKQIVLFAGGTGAPNSNETWVLSLNGTPSWTLASIAAKPQGRQFHTAVIDPIGDRMLVFGGSSGPVLSDAWALPLAPNSVWRPFSGTRRKGHTAVLDVSRNRMLVFGGEDATQLNDVWELALGNPPQWTRLNPSGTPPSPRALHGAIYDGKRDRMIVFGGRGTTPTNDVWELSFSGEVAWRPVPAVGTPPAPRLDPVVVYDTYRRRMLVFGGADATGVYNDVWALSLSGTPTWTLITTTGTVPTARAGSQAIYDPLRDRLIVHGGYNKNYIAQSDLYALSLSGTPAWTQLSPSGTPPAPRFASVTVYDPSRDRMIVESGTDFADFFSDTWALNLAGTTAWSTVTNPGVQPLARSDHKGVYDENLDRLVFFGGISPLGILHDAWELDFTATIDVPVTTTLPSGARVALASVVPNPAPRAAASTIAFTLSSAGEVHVTVHDALGRRVRSLDAGSGALEAGPHRVVWDGRSDGGAAMPAGLYFVRVETAGSAASGKLVRLD
jgi:hypothetical protein